MGIRKSQSQIRSNRGIICILHDGPFTCDVNYRGTGSFQRLNPHFEGVYEIKLTDIRIFGWFPKPLHFIAAFGALKKDIKGTKKVNDFVKQTITIRKQMPTPACHSIKTAFNKDVIDVNSTQD